MKKHIKKIAALLAILILMPMGTALAIDTEVIDERWGKPVYVYGGGLSESEVQQTGKLLGITNYDNVNAMSVTGEDEIKYLGSGEGVTGDMISSVLVKKRGENYGVNVTIETPDKITQITADQYRNASITAGVTNADIIIASVKPVTGESALTGVYKAFDTSGEALNTVRMQVAQKELETTNDIAQENKDKSGFNINNLNQVIINVKQELGKVNTETGEVASLDEIRQFIEEAIVKYDLKEVVTSEQVNRLVQLFEEYQTSGAVNDAEVKEQLGILASQVKDKATQIYEDAKESGLLDKILSGIASFFQWVSSLIGS
ncbi:MAG: DUF1002 domain-containing protein [Tissierellia bacterium]|nr:DUF1002 domain-containing protein [Tissierellia bacterium]